MAQTISSLEYFPLSTTMPLMNPKYPPQYEQKFTALKKHIQLKLFNSEANQLAEQLIHYGETNYNCWYVKKMCYLAGVISFEHEMEFSEQTLYEKIKNFQLWEHRRFLLERNCQMMVSEYQLIDKILKIEPKNYHAWSHRTWIVAQVKNYPQQLQFTRVMLKNDVYNNSVWAYRSYLIIKMVQEQSNDGNKAKIVQIEISQVLSSLRKHMNNQAAWNYLRGYFPSIRLKSIPCVNSHTAQMSISETTTGPVLEFLKLNVSELQKTLNQQNHIAKHYQMESEIQLLTTLVCFYSQKPDTLEYARNTCDLLAQKDAQKRFYRKWVAINL